MISCTDSNKQESINSDSVLIDDLGNKFELTASPKRVITLAPNLTEMIYALNQEDRLVGNTLYCNYPKKAEEITKVGDMLTMNYEVILSLKPDLVFITVEGNTKENYDKLKEFGINVFVSNPRNYNDIKKTFLQFGKFFDAYESADSIAKTWDEQLSEIRSQIGNKKKTALFLAAITPIMAAGRTTFINEFIEICGLENIVKESKINYPVFSREEIIKVDPDYIIYASKEELTKKYLTDIYAEWKNLSAVKNDNIIFVDPDLFYRPGPRFAEAAKTLYTKINKP
jgi:iron complex transport system substrate-binding protein